MAEPKQKSLELPAYLTRILPLWSTPQWMEAERWRRVVYNIPGSIVCRDTLIADAIASDWEITAKDPDEKDAVQEDADYYTDVLNGIELGAGITGLDPWLEKMLQDMLTIPAGGSSEIVRWPPGTGPLSRPHPKGHVHQIIYMDGATIFPTYDREFVLGQRLRQNVTDIVYFRRDEIGRMLLSARPEIERWGYGMAPPEKIYLAITLLFRGDQYYANLLLDTPEAGVLDLIDMSKDSATEWVQSLKTLFEGIDPFKIPVLYQHDKAAVWIPFGRPPTEMMFDATYGKYLGLTHAGYGLTLTDTGLGDQQQRTLAGSIRDERRSQRSGFATTREKVRTFMNTEVLPPYLRFVWITKDEEAKVQKGRSFLLSSQALAKSKEAGFISRQEGQAQLVQDGHITVEVQPPEEPETPPQLAPFTPGGNGNMQDEMDKVPASEGGRGDITGRQEQRADLGEETISAVPRNSANFDQLAQVIRTAFAPMLRNATRPRLLKLVKAATRRLFPAASQAVVELADFELPSWIEERSKLHFGEPSEFDDLADVCKADGELLDELEGLLETDDWWAVSSENVEPISLILKLAYQEGATEAANTIQEFLYTEGLADSPDIIGLNFNLTNPTTLAQLEKSAAQLVTRINDGTRFYLKRIITGAVEEGLASPSIAQMIREGSGVEEILKEAGFTEDVIRKAKFEIEHLAEMRTNSIVNTEIAKAETEGRLGQWGQMGLTRKQWVHTGPDVPCPICTLNIELGLVPIDFLYTSVFGEATVSGPPAHPQVDHCHIEFDEGELMARAGELEVWAGA